MEPPAIRSVPGPADGFEVFGSRAEFTAVVADRAIRFDDPSAGFRGPLAGFRRPGVEDIRGLAAVAKEIPGGCDLRDEVCFLGHHFVFLLSYIRLDNYYYSRSDISIKATRRTDKKS